MSENKRWQRIVFVTGHRRGGTTWLGRVLSLAKNSGYIFEPLTQTRHPRTSQFESLRRFHQSKQHWMQHTPPAEGDGEYAGVALRQVEELFDLYYAAPVETLITKHPGIEYVPFLQGVLMPDATIYIKRDPIAVLNSYLKSNLHGAWQVRQQFQCIREELARLRPDLYYMADAVGDDSEREILCMCCLSHRLAEEWASQGKLIVVMYRDLAIGGPSFARKLYGWLGLQFSEDKAQELNRLFSPERSQDGFLDTEKESLGRVNAYVSELAPWQISKARRYLDRIGYDVVVPQQRARAQIAGTWEYARREGKALTSSVRTALLHVRDLAMRNLTTMSFSLLTAFIWSAAFLADLPLA